MTTTPDDADLLLSPADLRVADEIARLRKDNGLTLRELGERTGLSQSYLSRVENGKAALSIANLQKIADAFALPVAAFFENPDEGALLLVRRGEGKTVRLRGRQGILVEMLALERSNRHMEPFIVDVSSAEPGMGVQQHPGEEFLYVLEGRCRFAYDGELFALNTGDALYFDATRPHKVQGVGSKCRLLAVVTASGPRFHGSIPYLRNG